MGQFVIRRDDGKYVAVPGSRHSYTGKLEDARVFGSRDEAEADRCVENERVVPIEDLVGKGRQR